MADPSLGVAEMLFHQILQWVLIIKFYFVILASLVIRGLERGKELKKDLETKVKIISEMMTKLEGM